MGGAGGRLAAGAARLQLTDAAGVLEVGIWLTRSARGRGVSVAALGLLLDEAEALGADAVVADTAVTNVPAQAALRRLGFTLDAAEVEGRVRARVDVVAVRG